MKEQRVAQIPIELHCHYARIQAFLDEPDMEQLQKELLEGVCHLSRYFVAELEKNHPTGFGVEELIDYFDEAISRFKFIVPINSALDYILYFHEKIISLISTGKIIVDIQIDTSRTANFLARFANKINPSQTEYRFQKSVINDRDIISILIGTFLENSKYFLAAQTICRAHQEHMQSLHSNEPMRWRFFVDDYFGNDTRVSHSDEQFYLTLKTILESNVNTQQKISSIAQCISRYKDYICYQKFHDILKCYQFYEPLSSLRR
ncbi:MAG: hypothetical protein A3I77_02715 [Gammaproteobacteria bacterium RIFCSPLOWO2_02_FULL_42_14]|nr:MAG: hypothetical protein A3B71_08100 [Gammaproteobacteria bacterium RIFCSPHIGHO2_02_FULL_42_43]OGT27415.1 MAG: hypothetical protein A2624_06740 [Gammaproteobacteria bacterium RIFCSPHIGHO2_01_FULL_42_8]OGT52376.1 MAG: hypothetical protein A3E54_01975 [Gammaproteobacteria bacterium RIFCSPHIGHO2_12_FULL_41_25]OGT63333.1 MAG: hypothetical protein A3I77_02715 [Gammaproteobacteria bacterium RIFCSPLOWO2_02_FULL_42_14]OGT86301.1 MAG: hypothetical protein A3G86_07180 [Gammaproteobacteria bacterium R